MQWLKTNSGWLITVFLCLLTTFLWLLDAPLPNLTSAGQIAGLLGLTLFSLSLILSGRFRFSENLFGGMNRVYIAHHVIGGVAFLLLLLHPLLISAAFLPVSTKLAAAQFIPSTNWAQNLGIVSLLVLISLIVFTYYVNIPYQVWRFTHKFMGLAFFLGGVHSLFIPSSISRVAPLRYYLMFLAITALASYLYRTVLGRMLIKRYVYVVQAVKNIGNQTIEINLQPAQTSMAYASGQFLFIGFPRHPRLAEVHPFSISSAPVSPVLRVSIKALGDYTTRLLDLQSGDIAQIEGPYGKFSYSNYLNQYQVWVAGGIGITPFLSMAQTLGLDHTVFLYYCVKDAVEAVYLKQLQMLASVRPTLRVVPFFSQTQGRISAAVFKKDLGDEFIKYDYFICGPPPMMKNLKTGLHKLKIPLSKIHTEEFTIN